MMNFDDFINEAVDKIKRNLPEWFDNAKVEVVEMRNLNENYVGLKITLPDEKYAPCLNMSAAYGAYMDGVDMDAIVDRAVVAFTEPIPELDTENLLNYESVKDKLFVRIWNVEKNQDVLAGLPHTMKEDLAMTYHVLIAKNEGGIASLPINESIFARYGVSLEQLHEDALKSSPIVLPIKADSLTDIMKADMRKSMEMAGCHPEDIEAALDEFNIDLGMQVVTNEVGKNGASAIFYPGVMDEFADKMGGDFYIIPSSTDEVLLMPDDRELTIAQLNAMVQEVNAAEVSPEMRLGNEVYHYDATDKVFEKASAHAERMAQKAEEKETGSERNSILKKMDDKKKEIACAVKDAVAPKRTVEATL